MKITLKTTQSPYNLMRRCGYFHQGRDEKTGQLVFIRPLSGSDYPRFHVYLEVSPRTFCRSHSAQDNEVVRKRCGVSRETITINLHLDQKKPVYKGAPAHAAEYSGKVVEKEAERIRKIAGP